MSLRLKLLLIFVAGALSALTFFGYVAYDTAKTTNIKNEAALLAGVAPRIADDVHHNLEHGLVWAPLLTPEGDASIDNPIFLLVTDFHNNIIRAPETAEFQHVYREFRKSVPDTETAHAGSFQTADATYAWARSNVPVYDYRATLISRSQTSVAHAFFREMGVTLIFTGFLLLWCASWAAMYIAGLFEKLDDQKNILRHRALHDELTQLPNRALLNDRMQQIIQAADREPSRAALCFIDLNRFKEVNDTLGHSIGDELLLEVGRRLHDHLRKSDTVARIGGDEFALILRNVDEAAAKVVVDKLLEAVEAPIELRTNKFCISGSAGIALFPAHGSSVEVLMQKADVAMYAAKRSGARLSFYNPDFEVFSRDKLALTHDLRDAIQNNHLELYYQPKYHVAEKRVTGAEALLRWKHPTLGNIPPMTFVQIAEHTGLIRSLTKWVLQRAFEDCAHLAKLGHQLNIAINLSAHNLQDPELEPDIYELLEHWQVDAKNITLELTESAVVHNLAKTKELLGRLHDRGFQISVDDFGTGYSTLTNLRRLPISEIKIDRSFVSNIKRDAEDASIVRATIDLGKALGINVVAEGVETQDVLEQLEAYGCHTIQGYFISKPMPLAAFTNWLHSSSVVDSLSQPLEAHQR